MCVLSGSAVCRSRSAWIYLPESSGFAVRRVLRLWLLTQVYLTKDFAMSLCRLRLPSIQFCLLWLLAQGWPTSSPAAEPPADDSGARYLRLQRDALDNPLALQTAIVRFESDAPERQGVAIDLIGAVHVGERDYYEALNKAFDDYDVVLYELVAPPGTRVPKGGKSSNHPVSAIQNGLKNLLGLEHQLECVDYEKKNLVHADMSPDQFSKSMQDRGESFWTLFFRLMGEGISRQAKYQSQGKSFDADLLLALFDKDRASRLKRVMAEQFEDLEGSMEAFNGQNGSTIITERNKVALEGLTAQLAGGKKHIAIFYGAGHLPDMAERLTKDFTFKRTGERWLTAWNLADPSKQAAEAKGGGPQP